MYQNCIVPYLYGAQHVSGDTPPIIRSLKLHWQPLVFSYMEGCWTCSWWRLSGTVLCLTTSTNYTSNNFPRMKKPEAASAVLGSWWWAVCRPKHVELYINTEQYNFDTLLHLVGFFFMKKKDDLSINPHYFRKESRYSPTSCNVEQHTEIANKLQKWINLPGYTPLVGLRLPPK